MFSIFNDLNADVDPAIEVQISKIGASIETEEEYASEILNRAG